MNELISERELASGRGWRIVAVKYWSDPWNAKEKVVLEPDAFVSSRELRKSLSALLEWRNKINDAQGPDLEAAGPAVEKLFSEWHEKGGDRRINIEIAAAMNRHIGKLFESDPDVAARWLDDLGVSGEDRDMVGEWLTRDQVRNVFRKWNYRWRNFAIEVNENPGLDGSFEWLKNLTDEKMEEILRILETRLGESPSS